MIVGDRRRRLLNRMGLSTDDYRALLEAQNGWCAICCDHEATHIDHDHATDEFRGLLCTQCNLLLGMARDSIWVLSQAISYLEDSRRKCQHP